MNANRWARIKDHFLAAIQQEEAQAYKVLQAIHDEDPTLVEEVASLVREHFRLESSASRAPAGEPPTANSKLELPEFLSNSSRFHLAERIGSGTFGDVYKVHDTVRGEFVALKILREHSSAPLLYFKREFRSLADLHHPNLVRLYEMFRQDPHWMFTMELVEGQNYLDFIRKGPNLRDSAGSRNERESRIRATVPQFAAALKALHSHGLLHRDLKPSNVLVTKECRVAVLDFGLVRGFGEDSSASLTIAGTPDYMSPEQAAFGPLTEASDWYAVGVMLYQALSGALPFTGSVADVLRRKQIEQPRPPNEVDPDIAADLSQFCLGLIDRNPAVRLRVSETATYAASTGTDSSPQPPSSSHRPDFVGRQLELVRMKDAFNLTLGQLVSVHLSGASGVGKTILIREFLGRLRAVDPTVLLLTGRCFSGESVPYKGIDDLVDNLTHYLRRMSKEEIERLLPRNFPLLTRLFPVLAEIRATNLRGEFPPDSVELRSRAFAALKELLGRIAERHRVVLVIDDLQWGDLDGCAFLKELIESPDAPALLLLLAYRSEDIEVVAWLKALRFAETTNPDTTVLLDLKGLDSEESADLARVLTRSWPGFGEDAVRTLVEESGGNPFLVHEITYWLASQSARSKRFSVRDALKHRCSELGTSERRLLGLIAVAGQPVPIVVFKNAFPASDLAAARDALFVARLLRSRVVEGHEEVEVYHDRIREAVLTMLSQSEVTEHHQQLALALEAFGGADTERLALHFHYAGDRGKAAASGKTAAEKAARALAFNKAARFYTLALEDGTWNKIERLSLFRNLGDALSGAGQGFQASVAYESAAELAVGLERRRLLSLAAGQQLRSGYIRRGLALLGSVLSEVGLHSPAHRELQLLWVGFLRIRIRIHGFRFRERAAEEIDPERLFRIDLCGTAALGLSMLDPLRSVEFSSRYVLLALKAGEPYRVGLALAGEATQISHSTRSNTRKAAQELLRRSDEIANRLQSFHGRAYAMIMRGVVAYLNGSWQRAVELCEEAADILRSHCHGVQWELNTASTFAFVGRFVLGEWAQNRRLLPTLIRDAESRGDLYGQLSLRILGCAYILDLAAGQPAKALSDLNRDLGLWAHEKQYDLQRCNALIGKIDISIYWQKPQDGLAHLEREWPLLEKSGLLRLPTTFSFSHCARGRLALAMAGSATGSSREKFLRIARDDARKLLERGPAWSHGLALMLQSGVASFTRDGAELRHELAVAEEALRLSDFTPFRMAVLYRQASLEPAPRSTAQWAEVTAWTVSEEITSPEKVLAGLAPGLWRELS
jgi:serine/threonine protein kinase